jgi:hypothetical protein
MQRDCTRSAWRLLSTFSIATHIQSLLYTMIQEILEVELRLNRTFLKFTNFDFGRYVA